MKQLIIMMATIILGIGIATVVLGFEDTANEIGKTGMEKALTIVEAPAEASE